MTSRGGDPQLHTHCVLANMTRNASGEWRSVEPTAIRRSEKLIGAYYRNELAMRLQAMGMAVTPTLIGRVPGFELAGYEKSFLDAFSGRRRDILAYLEKHDLPYTPELAQMAALATRPPKRETRLAELVPGWREKARALGLSRDKAVLRPARRLLQHRRLAAARMALDADDPVVGQKHRPDRFPLPLGETAAGKPFLDRIRIAQRRARAPPGAQEGENLPLRADRRVGHEGAVHAPALDLDQLAVTDQAADRAIDVGERIAPRRVVQRDGADLGLRNRRPPFRDMIHRTRHRLQNPGLRRRRQRGGGGGLRGVRLAQRPYLGIAGQGRQLRRAPEAPELVGREIGRGNLHRRDLLPGGRVDRMGEVLRQKDRELLRSVMHARHGEAGEAMGLLGRERVREVPREELGAEAARRWLALAPEDRAETAVMAPTHEIRRQANRAIREGLAEDGTLHGRALAIDRLVPRRLTRALAADIASYEPGDTLVFHRDVFGCAKDDVCTVTAIGDDTSWTPLMHAADKGRTLLVPPLLKAGADPNMRASDGATALFMATLHNHSEIMAALIEANADPGIRGPQGKTAIDVAKLKYGNWYQAQKGKVDQAVLDLLNRGKSIVDAADFIGRIFSECGRYAVGNTYYDHSVEIVSAGAIRITEYYHFADRPTVRYGATLKLNNVNEVETDGKGNVNVRSKYKDIIVFSEPINFMRQGRNWAFSFNLCSERAAREFRSLAVSK